MPKLSLQAGEIYRAVHKELLRAEQGGMTTTEYDALMEEVAQLALDKAHEMREETALCFART